MDFYVDKGVLGDNFVPLSRGMDAVPEEISIGINIGNNRITQSLNWVKERGGIHDVAKSKKSGSPSYRLEELTDFDVGNSNSPKVATQALQLIRHACDTTHCTWSDARVLHAEHDA